jgi:hypothetical protein
VTPQLIAGGLLFAAGLTGGWTVNNWRHAAQELAIQKAGEAATQAAVAEIKNIRIQRVTVRQELEREIRVLPSDGRCDLGDGLFNTLNKAITGQDSGGTGVPGTDAADGPAVRDATP